MLRQTLFLMITFIFTILLPLKVNGSVKNTSNTCQDNVIMLQQLTREIVTRYFTSFRCVLVVSERSSSEDEETNVADFIPGNIATYNVYLQEQQIQSNLTDNIILNALNAKCNGLIFQVSDPAHMVVTVTRLSRRSLARANRRFLFLPTDVPTTTIKISRHTKYSSAVNDVLKMREMNFFPDLIMARFLMNENDSRTTSIELLTHKFSGKTTYMAQLLLGIWSKSSDRSYGFLRSVDMYPDKVSNLMGKRLVMATFTYRPYSIIDLDAKPPIFDGTESRIALEFCKKLNATWDVSVDAENEWGEIYENDTGNGILGTVAEDRAELGFGAIYLWNYEYHYVDYSIPYIRTGITCVAPRPHPLPGFLTPVLPFTITSWAAVGASVVAATMSLYFVTKATEKFPTTESNVNTGANRYTSIWDCAFNALGLLVLQTPPDERRSTRLVGPNRHVLVWLTIMFLLITTSYGSGLASILTIPRFAPPIETVPDLAASNIPWAATHPAWMFSLREGRDPLTLHITSQFRVMKTDEMKKHSFMGDTAFSIERLPAGHYAIGEYITEEAASTKLRLMKQDLYYEYVPTVVRKGSPYIDRLNKLILHLMDSGLMLKWEEQVVSAFLPMRVQRAVTQSRKSSSDDHGPTNLQYRHIEGSLYLLYLGLLISVVAFAGELLYNKYQIQISSLKNNKN